MNDVWRKEVSRPDWDSVCSEQALLERYGLTERQLQTMRAKGLPFIRASATVRLYEEGATVGWLVGQLTANQRRPRKGTADGS